jgi:SHS2 domain-containing protein
MEHKQFEYLDHTADIEFRAYGKTLKDVFSNAARAFSNSIVDIKTVTKQKEFLIEKDSESIEALLFDFLSELLVKHEVEHVVYCDFVIKSLRRTANLDGKSGWHITCKAYGEKLDIKKHSVDVYVKAITYSQMKIEKKNGGFAIQMVLDI